MVIESAAFAGKNRLQRQRMVNAALGDIPGQRVHALERTIGKPLFQRRGGRVLVSEAGLRATELLQPGSLVRWIAGVGLRMLAIGALAGLLTARALSGALEGLLFGVSPSDALTAAGVIAVITLVGLTALLIPSWRATRIDPVAILRRG